MYAFETAAGHYYCHLRFYEPLNVYMLPTNAELYAESLSTNSFSFRLPRFCPFHLSPVLQQYMYWTGIVLSGDFWVGSTGSFVTIVSMTEWSGPGSYSQCGSVRRWRLTFARRMKAATYTTSFYSFPLSTIPLHRLADSLFPLLDKSLASKASLLVGLQYSATCTSLFGWLEVPICSIWTTANHPCPKWMNLKLFSVSNLFSRFLSAF